MSWFRRILELAAPLASQQGDDFVVAKLGALQGVNKSSERLEKDEDYLTVKVKSSRIINIRRWTRTIYGCIQSRAHYLHADRGVIEYQTVIVPSNMKDLDPRNLDAVIQIDKPILGPVPFVGSLSLELGLFSVKGTDLAAPYIDLLTTLADKASVGFFATALPFVDPLIKGAALLFGNNNQSQLEIGLDRSWDDLETGYWLLMRAPKNEVLKDDVIIADIRLDPADFRLTDPNGKAYRNYPYMVFEIAKSRRRDDWMMIPELKQAWEAIGVAAKAGEVDKAEQLLKQFSVICEWSPDLVPVDARRLAGRALARLPQLQKETVIAASKIEQHPLGEFSNLGLYN